jgi:hypothetical protein
MAFGLSGLRAKPPFEFQDKTLQNQGKKILGERLLPGELQPPGLFEKAVLGLARMPPTRPVTFNRHVFQQTPIARRV